jgi:hypothetical protein
MRGRAGGPLSVKVTWYGLVAAGYDLRITRDEDRRENWSFNSSVMIRINTHFVLVS